MSALLSLVQFATQSPAWRLQDLDNNFAQLNSAVSGILNVGTFPATIVGGFNASATFNYVSVGPINFVMLPVGIVDSSANVGPAIISGLPPALWPVTQQLTVYGGLVEQNGQTPLQAAVTIQTNGTISVSPTFATSNGISSNASFIGNKALLAGFSFCFPTM
jgi:hypothetical protein